MIYFSGMFAGHPWESTSESMDSIHCAANWAVQGETMLWVQCILYSKTK